jgi:F-type H+-transporting ATPase subunit epsilon
MATKETSFHCKVVTPERVVFDAPVEFVALPAWDGEIGILRQRAPLMIKLGIGILRLKGEEGAQQMAIEGGFAEMVDNSLSVLTEGAYFADDLDLESVETALAKAQALEAHDAAAVTARADAMARAKAQRKIL